MRTLKFLLPILLAFVVAAAPAGVQRYAGEVLDGRYIVKLKQGVQHRTALNELTSAKQTFTHEWETESGFNGFAGNFDEDTIKTLISSPYVEYVAEDGVVHSYSSARGEPADVEVQAIQTNAPWGLARISQVGRLVNQNSTSLSFTYNYNDAAGAGVDIYVIGSCLNNLKSGFGGRARWAATFGGYANADGHGHGTHIAGTAASSQFGVAKAASLLAVKVLSDSGSGTIADVISGINYVINVARASGRPSVILLALGASASTSLDSAVVSATSSGIHVVVAAGHSNTDVSNWSPARVPSAITVAACAINDSRVSSGNYGSGVDVYAPGLNIISTWIGSPNATNMLSGSSMAAAHVAGIVAYLISVHGNMSPAAMESLLKQFCTKGALTGVPSGTPNCLANIGGSSLAL
ncbi:hypothetical protein AX16_000210 [Volvariella volvacea WC 439]|nr:hypothetical protein AX16_000210 [Volvariella volvacea WC 439]